MPARWQLVFCLASLSLAASCGPALRLTKNNSPIQGVPFYIKEAQCLHQMVYAMPYYRLTLQFLNAEKVQGSETVTISEDDYLNNKAVQDLLTLVRKKPPLSEADFDRVARDWSDIHTLDHSPYQAIEEGKWKRYVVSNLMSPKIYVNYNDVYTLNAKTPLAGSVNADYKLADDGTLTEASAQVNDQTLSTILSALPTSDLIKAAAIGGLPTLGVAEERVLPPTTVQLLTERRAIKITKSQSIPFAPGCPDANEFEPNKPTSVAVEDIGPETSTSSAGKSDDNSIAVSGKITLPNAKLASPAPGAGPAKPTKPQ